MLIRSLIFLGLCLGVYNLNHLTLRASAQTENSNYLVLGVIASTKSKAGVALLKDKTSGRTFASKEGAKVGGKMTIQKVDNKYVEVLIAAKVYKLRVGDETATAVAENSLEEYRPTSAEAAVYAREIERSGDTLSVSKSFKDHLLTEKLPQILMQAAAVPKMEGGRIVGFELWEIEQGSLFEAMGLKNGDTITAINGYKINDVGNTIRQLNSLRSASEANFSVRRQGKEEKIKLNVRDS